MKRIRGLSWAHTRGHAPVVAAGAAWSDRYPDVDVDWTRRSLAEFAAGGLAEYIGQYDLVSLDYPLVGEAAESNWIEPLDSYLSADHIESLRRATIGRSFESYEYRGSTWAAPLDVSALASAYRQDLLDQQSLSIPQTLSELIDFASATRQAAVPLSVFSCVALYLSFLAQLGATPFDDSADGVVETPVGIEALEWFRRLAEVVPPDCLEKGAVQLLSQLASTDELIYVGYAYGYSTYSGKGYFPHQLDFAGVPPLVADSTPRPTLGGVGLALLTGAPERAAAIDFLRWVTSAECQERFFALAGGQPAVDAAWRDPIVNDASRNYYSATYASVVSAYVRPNDPWYGLFQPIAGRLLQDFIRERTEPKETQAALDRALRAAKSEHSRGA